MKSEMTILILIAAVLILMITSFIQTGINWKLQDQAIERGCAAYDTQTGRWDWIKP